MAPPVYPPLAPQFPGVSPYGLPFASYTPAAPALPLPPVVSQPLALQPVPSSSPINSAGRPDKTKVVRDFFNWLLEQQDDEEERIDVIAARDVAIRERWRVDDLRRMSETGGELYNLVVDRYKLKDGIVRYMREDLRDFKRIYRAGESLDL
jgi:hypothetical protein